MLRIVSSIAFITLLSFQPIAQDCDTTVYEVVEVMPEYPGGMSELMNYMMDVSLPKLENENEIIGSFCFSFIVQCDGQLADITALKNPDHPYTIAVKKHIEQIPKWTAGLHQGRHVYVRYTLPIHISIN